MALEPCQGLPTWHLVVTPFFCGNGRVTNMLAPTTEAELADAIATAKEPLQVCGGGTRGIHTQGAVLKTTGLTGITLYDPGALTLVAQAGTPLSEIEAALDAENQMLAFEPIDFRTLLGTKGEPTIGGVVATNASGPRRVQAGACRDYLLGVRFVDGSGTVIKNGGRVMKNVTGYDLARMMCGAHGTLGVLTEVSLKVLPKPETEATLVLPGLNVCRAVDAMSAAMTSPFEVSGAANFVSDGVSKTLCRLEGFDGSVGYRSGKLKETLSAFGDVEVIADAVVSRTLWQAVRDVEAFADQAAVTRVSLKPSDLRDLYQELAQVMPKLGGPASSFDMLLDRAGGTAWIAYNIDVNEDACGVHNWLQDYVAKTGGHSTFIKGQVGADMRRFQPEIEPLASMAQVLRAKYDPRGILNQGLMN